MSTIEFVKDEIQEALAVDAFKAYRLKQGVICKKCGSKRHYWLANKQQFQCVSCRFRTTLRSGSVLEGTKLPYSYFFMSIHLLIKHGYKLTTEDFQNFTGHKYFGPIWHYLRNIKATLKEEERVVIYQEFVERAKQYLDNKN